ncbi:MAG: hypothetical protein J3K34DRAFT_429723, partial [Monoraphidium minutum]
MPRRTGGPGEGGAEGVPLRLGTGRGDERNSALVASGPAAAGAAGRGGRGQQMGAGRRVMGTQPSPGRGRGGRLRGCSCFPFGSLGAVRAQAQQCSRFGARGVALALLSGVLGGGGARAWQRSDLGGRAPRGRSGGRRARSPGSRHFRSEKGVCFRTEEEEEVENRKQTPSRGPAARTPKAASRSADGGRAPLGRWGACARARTRARQHRAPGSGSV